MSETHMKTLERLKDHFSQAQYNSLQGKLKEGKKSILGVFQAFANDDTSLIQALEELVEQTQGGKLETTQDTKVRKEPISANIEVEENKRAYESMKATLPYGQWALFIGGKLAIVSDNKQKVLKKAERNCYLGCVGRENEVCKIRQVTGRVNRTPVSDTVPPELERNIKAYHRIKDTLKIGSWALFINAQLQKEFESAEEALKHTENNCYLVCVGYENEVKKIHRATDRVTEMDESNRKAIMEDLKGKLANVPDEHWVLYKGGKLVEINEDPDQLIGKIEKGCLLTQKGDPFPTFVVM